MRAVVAQSSVTDLPDPLDQPPAPQGSSPDDLLSQMADEAIDKLMADADRGASTSRPTPAHLNDSKTRVDETSTDGRGMSGVEDLVLEPEPAVEAGAVQSELDAVFDKLDDEKLAGNAADSVLRPPPEATTELVANPDTEIASLDTAAEPDYGTPIEDVPASKSPTPSETPAVTQPVAPTPTHATPSSESTGRAADVRALLDEAVTSNAGTSSAVGSILLLPLRILNAPFNGLSDGARNTLGQIGIMTLLNAVAVLVYVIWFRRGGQ